MFSPFFFFNDTATTEIYTLSLHDALPILPLTLADFVPYLIGFAAAGGFVWLFIYFRGKRKRGGAILAEAPAKPADELALDTLRALESERVRQRGKNKEDPSRCTDVTRPYIV